MGCNNYPHRCVLASCSPWFDTKLKVHKTMKETIEVESCKNYEVFHLVLTYMYTGKISLDKHNVDDILDISHNFTISKLKGYAVEYLEKMLRANNCLKIIELSAKYHLSDLSKQTMAFINKNFKYIVQYHDIEKMSLTVFQEFLNKAWYFPNELVLRFITCWVSQEKSGREENFNNLLHNVTWSSLDPTFISSHLDKEEFFYSSPESLLTVLRLLNMNNIVLNHKFTQVYHDLQDREIERERLYPDHDLEQELDDNNSFLSIAINSAVKDLEHQEVDETFSSYILQPEPYAPYRHPSGPEQGPIEAGTPDMMVLQPYMSPTNLVKAPLERVKTGKAGLEKELGVAEEQYPDYPEESQYRGLEGGGGRYPTPPSGQTFQQGFPEGQEYRGLGGQGDGGQYRGPHDYRGVQGYTTGPATQLCRADGATGTEYNTEGQDGYRTDITTVPEEYTTAATIGTEYGAKGPEEYRTIVTTASEEYRTIVTTASEEYRTIVTVPSEEYRTVVTAPSEEYRAVITAPSEEYRTVVTTSSEDYTTVVSASSEEYRAVVTTSSEEYKTSIMTDPEYRTSGTTETEEYQTSITAVQEEYSNAVSMGTDYRSAATSESQYRNSDAIDYKNSNPRSTSVAEYSTASDVLKKGTEMQKGTGSSSCKLAAGKDTDQSLERIPFPEKEPTVEQSIKEQPHTEEVYMEPPFKDQLYKETPYNEKLYDDQLQKEQEPNKEYRVSPPLTKQEALTAPLPQVERLAEPCPGMTTTESGDGQEYVVQEYVVQGTKQKYREVVTPPGEPNKEQYREEPYTDPERKFPADSPKPEEEGKTPTCSEADNRTEETVVGTEEYSGEQPCKVPPFQEQALKEQQYKEIAPQPPCPGISSAPLDEQYRPPSCGQPLPPEPPKPDCRLPGLEGQQYCSSPGAQYPVLEYPAAGGEQYRVPALCQEYLATDSPSSQAKVVLPLREVPVPEQGSARNSPLSASGAASHVASPAPVQEYPGGGLGAVQDYSGLYREGYGGERMYRQEYREEGRPVPLYDGTLYRSTWAPGMEQYSRGCGQYSEAYRLEEREYSVHYREGEGGRHRLDRLPSRTDFDFSTEYQILEQVINEHQMSEAASGKYSDRMSTTKRYDPKHRALAEAFRQMEAEMADQAPPVPTYAMEAQCGAARPLEQGGGSKREGGADCQYARGGEGRRALATPVPDPEFSMERPVEAEPREVKPAPAAAPPSPPPASLLHLASCAQEPLHTPEKAEAAGSSPPPLLTPRARVSSSKTEAQQLFLTPKEKYAKGVSALSDIAKKTVSIDLNQEIDVPKENESPEKEEEAEESPPPVKKLKITVAHILRAKKKMASQKKLILEHGEVRLTQRQRLRIRPVRKRVPRKLKANDVFQRTESPAATEAGPEAEVAKDPEVAETPVKKRIVNRKDKLLAEHRSQSLHTEEVEGGQAGTVQQQAKRVFTCPICGVETSTGKDHFQHIKVTFCHSSIPPTKERKIWNLKVGCFCFLPRHEFCFCFFPQSTVTRQKHLYYEGKYIIWPWEW